MDIDTPLLKPDEVAKKLSITQAHLYSLIEQKKIDAIKIGGRWRFEQSAIKKILNHSKHR